MAVDDEVVLDEAIAGLDENAARAAELVVAEDKSVALASTNSVSNFSSAVSSSFVSTFSTFFPSEEDSSFSGFGKKASSSKSKRLGNLSDIIFTLFF